MRQLQDQSAALRAQLGARSSDALLQELDLVVAERNNLADDAKALKARVAGLLAELAEAQRQGGQRGAQEEERARTLREDFEVARVQLSEQRRLVAQVGAAAGSCSARLATCVGGHWDSVRRPFSPGCGDT
jgi:hypothetical protein